MHLITQICVLLLWMHAVTFVTSKDCTLEEFINNRRLFDSHFDTTNLQQSYNPGKQVRVTCSVGFTGFFKLICTDRGWESRGSKCQAKSCGHPGDAQFADFNLEKGDDFVFGSEVVYTCHKGYQMVSRTNYRRCLSEGWDGVVPVCEAQQCPLVRVQNNVQVIGDVEEANFGNVIRFSCKSRTEILEGPTEIYCNENGEWSAEPPTCKEITCSVPVIENGDVIDVRNVYQENEVLEFSCNRKYKRSNDIPSKCTKLGSKSVWSPTPGCDPIRCKVDRLEGTTHDPPYKNLFLIGETVTVICDEKYWIFSLQETRKVSTCQDDGQWDIRPICQEVTCQNRRPPNMESWDLRWWDRPTLGDTVRFRCRYGYKRAGGATSVTCTRDGWTPDPACEERTCDREEITNADITGEYKEKYRYNEQIRYVCKEGYHRDQFTRTCGENGWNRHDYEQCREITCRPKDIWNAEIDRTTSEYKREYKYGDRVEYVCRNGYEGRFTITCGARGWIGNQHCTTKQCAKLDISNADLTHNDKERYSHGDTAQYTCRSDRNRKITITCEEGEWTGVQECEGNLVCSKPELEHGFAVESNGNLYYTCDDGFKLTSKGWWGEAKCNDGQWSELQRCIDKRKCGEVPQIPNMEEAVPLRDQSMRVVCKKGYKPQIERLTCGKGKWDTGGLQPRDICKPVDHLCKPPPKVENAVVTALYEKDYLPDEQVTYQCRNKYTLEGEATISCRNGKWDVNITCTLYCDRPDDKLPTMTYIVEADKQNFVNGSILQYTCKADENTRGNATCVDGKWIPQEQCEALSCEPPPTDEWITVKGLPENEDPILPDRFVTFSCDVPGKYLNGSSKLICGTDGKWDKPFPTCEDHSCKVDELALHLHVTHLPESKTVKVGGKIQFQCDSPYTVDGAVEIECTDHDKWSEPFPTCSERCRITEIPGSVRLYRHIVGQQLRKGEKLRFYCPIRGHYLQGNADVECLPSGQWSEPFPTCGEPVGCGPPPYIENADITSSFKRNYDHREQVEYRCANYYTIRGNKHKLCINGEWTGEMRCLKPCTVNRQLMNQHNIQFRYTRYDKLYSPHEDEIEFVCVRGTRHDRKVGMRQTCLDGVMPLPTCI